MVLLLFQSCTTGADLLNISAEESQWERNVVAKINEKLDKKKRKRNKKQQTKINGSTQIGWNCATPKLDAGENVGAGGAIEREEEETRKKN